MRYLNILLAGALVGCQPAPNNSTDLIEAKISIEALTNRLNSEAAERLALANRIDALESANGDLAKSAFLDPAGGPGYQILQTNVAPLLVSFVDSAPIGDGTAIRVQLGNMTSASFSGASIKVHYNRRVPEKVSEIEAWNKTIKTVEQKIPNDLRAGTWTTISVSLPGIKPENLGHVALTADLDVVALR